jgi:hypothetical protein
MVQFASPPGFLSVIACFSTQQSLVAGRVKYGLVMRPRIMYIECKAGGLNGPARIGRVTFSKAGRTLYYRGQSFQSLKGSGFKANYYEVESGQHYWISGPRHDGQDRLYASNMPVEIDDDVREEYWTEIRKKPELKNRKYS